MVLVNISMTFFSYLKLSFYIAILAAGYAAFVYYNWSQEEISTLKENKVKMEFALKSSEAAIQSLSNGIRETQIVHRTVTSEFQQSRLENTRLRNLLGRHDIGFLALKKPGLISKRVNNGTRNANRCLEIASGAPLTVIERNATRPSEINTACPEISNPKFKAKQ